MTLTESLFTGVMVSYQIVILSNQGGISLKSDPKSVKGDQKRLADFKRKVASVFNQLNLPISIYAATARDQYRKPRTGMWTEVLEDHDLERAESLDLDSSLFVGDAGGRLSIGGAGTDHACSDRYVYAGSLVTQLHSDALQRLRQQRWYNVQNAGRVLS